MSSLILVTTWGGNEYDWGSGMILGLTFVGLALLAAFVWQERRADEPVIPLSLFESRVFNVSSAMGATSMGTTTRAMLWRMSRIIYPFSSLAAFWFLTTSIGTRLSRP